MSVRENRRNCSLGDNSGHFIQRVCGYFFQNIYISTTYDLIHKLRTHIYYKYNIHMNMYIEQNLQWQEISHEGKTYNSKNNV